MTRRKSIITKVRECKLCHITVIIAVIEDSVKVKVIYLICIEIVTLVCRDVVVYGSRYVMFAESAVISHGKTSLLPVLHSCRTITAGSQRSSLVCCCSLAVEITCIVLGLAVSTQGVAVERERLLEIETRSNDIKILLKEEVTLESSSLL